VLEREAIAWHSIWAPSDFRGGIVLDVAEAVRTRDAFQEAADAARVVFEVLQAAERRLMIAIAAITHSGALHSPAAKEGRHSRRRSGPARS
jgi:hypothetical protein